MDCTVRNQQGKSKNSMSQHRLKSDNDKQKEFHQFQTEERIYSPKMNRPGYLFQFNQRTDRHESRQ